MPAARLIEIANSGHLILKDNPAALIAAVCVFLAGVSVD